MITKTMTSNEVIRALQKNHLVILDRMDGLGAKNSKKLKSKYVRTPMTPLWYMLSSTFRP